MTPHPLGRLVQHDPISRNFPARGSALLKTVLWEHKAPILDQGDLGSCEGNSLADALNCEYFNTSRPGRYLTETDAVKLYSLATQLDEFPGQYPPEDTGSSGIGVAKAGVKLGYLAGYTHAFGIDHFLAALMLSPMIVGTNWLDNMFDVNAAGFVDVSGEVAGGHAYLALGYDVSSTTITFLNSWGSSWGKNGRFKINAADFSNLLADQGDAITPVGKLVPPTPVPPTPPVSQKLSGLFTGTITGTFTPS